MNGIAGVGGPRLGAPAARAGRAAPGGFRLPGTAGEAAASAPPSAAAPVASPALPAPEEAAERDRRAARRAAEMLDDLSALQAALLGGEATVERLERLARGASAESPADPRLAEVLRAVLLRARVELAKRGRG